MKAIYRSYQRLLPEDDQVMVLLRSRTHRRGRSIYLGIQMAIMNFPRVLLTGVWRSLRIMATGLLLFFMSTFLAVFVTPALAVLGPLAAGLSGRLVDRDSDEARKAMMEDVANGTAHLH